jgi:thymidylate kinase
LHAYHQIVSGDSLVKNYRFPIEGRLLGSTCYLEGVRVPEPSAELALFVLRIVLKHVSPVEILKTNRHYDKVVDELAWLGERADSQRAADLCAAWFPVIEPVFFERLRRAIAGNALWPRMVLGWRVAWRLRHLRRIGWLSATASRYRRLLLFVAGRLRRRRDLALQTGGAIVALVGPKGTGKSTVGGQLAARLGRYLCVRRIHVGKPPPTLLSFLPRLFMPLGRMLLPHERLREYQNADRQQKERYSMLHVLRMLLVAYDRRRLIFRALRAATSGAIVIADRYPCESGRATDSTCFDEAAVAACRSRIKRWMMQRERALYRDLPRPTVVLKLVAPLDLVLERDAGRSKRGGPDPEAVRRRWHLESEPDFSSSLVVHIDASRPLDETIRSALQAVWQRL